MNWKCDQMSWIMEVESKLAFFVCSNFDMGHVYEALNDLLYLIVVIWNDFKWGLCEKNRWKEKQWGLKIAENGGDFWIKIVLIAHWKIMFFGG